MYRKVSIKNIKDLVLKSSGLEVNDVIEQRKVFGTNTIVEDTGHPWKALVSDTLKDPMVWFLIGIATLFFIIGDRKEAFILFVATLPLILMDAFLHWRTQASTSGLKSQLSSKVLVLRAGVKQKINSLDLVPGDLVILSEENNFLPADGYWEKTDSLQLDESVLTGESLPIVKSSTILEFKYDQEELSIESNCLGYAGTRVLSGNGLLRILSTGKNTSYGEIIQSVVTINHEQTPLQRAIFELTRYLIMAAILFCFLLAGIRYYQGHGWLDALLSAGVLAVAAIPEEFPVVFSFFLGVGVYRLAKHRALVRKAVSVENIGRVTQICTDKTGTITRGELQLAHVDLFPGIGEEHIISLALVASNLKGSDPVDVAIIEASRNKNIIIPERIHTIPFTEDRKRETAFFIKDDKNFCVVKGSPEVVMGLSNLAEGEFNEWNQRVLKWAKGGHKVLAVASSVIEGTDGKSFEGPTRGFSFLGLLVFEDPARPEVKNAILYCQRNAIKVLMITGDHPQTAEAIARDIGLGVDSPKKLGNL